jgi:hypothetical protein
MVNRLHQEYERMVREMSGYIDVEEKARTFKARYAGSSDHRWRTQIPHDDGRVGRMVIHEVPFEF